MSILRSVGYAACWTSLLLVLVSCSRPESADHSMIEPSFPPMPTIGLVHSPVTSATSAPIMAAALSLPLKLELHREDTDDGFSIEYESSELASVHMSQTWISPTVDGLSYGVHVLTSRISGDKQSAIQQDAVVVNPRTGQFHTYPLYHFTYQDEPDYSFSNGYGFMDDRYFIYISMKNDPDHKPEYWYEVMKLDILTGEKIVVSSNPSGMGSLNGAAHSWMNEAGDALYLNSFEGTLLRIDLATGESAVVAEGIKHTWPFYLTSISPDGERFWHTSLEDQAFNLYEADGKLLREVPFGDNNIFHFILWSTKGQYAYQEYTSEGSDIVERRNDPEFKDIAAEKIMIYDQDGKELEVISARMKGRYVELAGWVSDDAGLEYALIETYSWKPNEEGEDLYGVSGRKTNSTFSLYDPRCDEYRSLKLVTAKTRMKHPHAAMSGRGDSIYAVDIESGYVMEAAPQGYWVDSGTPDELVWVAYDAKLGYSNSVEVWNKQPEDRSSAYAAIDLRPYKATEGKLLSRVSMRYVTIK